MALHSRDVILWENRNRNVPDNVWCKISVDGTDFKVDEPFPFDPRWKSPKFKGGALTYEVGISIYAGDIVWVSGPYRGAKHDVAMFRDKLKLMLDDDELVETDLGYKDPSCRNKDDYVDEEEKFEKQRIRARHETCNHRFKVWGILKQQYRHDIEEHGLVFRAIACIVQMEIDDGGVLFGCTTTTRKLPRGTYTLG